MWPFLAGARPAHGGILHQGRAQRLPVGDTARFVGGVHDVTRRRARPVTSGGTRLPAPRGHRLPREVLAALPGTGGKPLQATDASIRAISSEAKAPASAAVMHSASS